MLHFAVTTNPDYVPKVECTENLFRSLFDLRLHLGSTVAPTAPQEPLEKPPLPVFWFLKRTVILDGDYMMEITTNHAAACAYPFN